jgi:hypothetical protein
MTANRLLPTTLISLLLLAGCAATERAGACRRCAPRPDNAAQGIAMLERVSWGVNGGSARQLQRKAGSATCRHNCIRKASLPPAIQAQIDAMTISQVPLDQLVMSMEQAQGVGRRDGRAGQAAGARITSRS